MALPACLPVLTSGAREVGVGRRRGQATRQDHDGQLGSSRLAIPNPASHHPRRYPPSASPRPLRHKLISRSSPTCHCHSSLTSIGPAEPILFSSLSSLHLPHSEQHESFASGQREHHKAPESGDGLANHQGCCCEAWLALAVAGRGCCAICTLGNVLGSLPPCPFASFSRSLQVVRYSALVGGIGYGILHRRTLQGVEDKNFAQAEWKRKENLIREAKEAYKNRLVQNVAAMQSDGE